MSAKVVSVVLAMLACMLSGIGYTEAEMTYTHFDMANSHDRGALNMGLFLNMPSVAVGRLRDNILSRQYLMAGFEKINTTSYVSSLGEDMLLQVHVDNENAADYRNIDPGKSGSYAEVLPGTTIIREVWTPDFEIAKYTVMIKMERGYFPEGGDFLYGVITPDGTIEEKGKLEECASCHAVRARDGYLFGVPEQYKTAPDPYQDLDSLYASLAENIITDELYLGGGFEKLNMASYSSALNSSQFLDVYVTSSGFPNYRLIDPAVENTHISLPERTVIVRVVKNHYGEIEKYTVMVKAPIGYFPEGGDFYYAVLDKNGEPLVDDNNQVLQGRLPECGDCHLSRSNDGFLFGVTGEVKCD